MGFFDKLFGSDNEQGTEKVMGLSESDSSNLHKHRGTHVIKGVVRFKDSSKEIKKEAWTNLTDSARAELISKGYYCEGDNADIYIVGLEPMCDK